MVYGATGTTLDAICANGISARFWTTVVPGVAMADATTVRELVGTCTASIVTLPTGMPEGGSVAGVVRTSDAMVDSVAAER